MKVISLKCFLAFVALMLIQAFVTDCSPNIDSKRGYRNLAFSATHGAAKSMKDTANAGTKFVSTVAGATATLTNDIYKVGSDTVKSGAHRLGNIRITGLRSEATDNRKLQKTISKKQQKIMKKKEKEKKQSKH